MGQRVTITKITKRRVLKTSANSGTKTCPKCNGSGKVRS